MPRERILWRMRVVRASHEHGKLGELTSGLHATVAPGPALAQAHTRELRLLDLLAQLMSQQSTPRVPQSVAPPRPTASQAPLSGLRQQIVAVLREHPKGLAPKAVQTLLQIDKGSCT